MGQTLVVLTFYYLLHRSMRLNLRLLSIEVVTTILELNSVINSSDLVFPSELLFKILGFCVKVSLSSHLSSQVFSSFVRLNESVYFQKFENICR